MPEEKDKDKIQQAQEEAEARAAARIAANKEETDALDAAQRAELRGLRVHNKAQYENVGQIVGDIQSKINTATAKDALARKREDAYRNITGLGDTLSSLANLVGTAHGAANQQQTYNSHAVVQKAEEARKARKIEMDDLSKRLDEMTARQKDLKAAGSLAEVQLKAKQARESLELASKQRQNEETARQYDTAQVRQAERDAREDFVADRAFTEGRRQFNATNTRLKANNTSKPEDEHMFEIAGGKTVTIPKHKWTRTALSSVYSIIPDEMKLKRHKTTTSDGVAIPMKIDGEYVYETPTEQEMLNDIIKAAKTDENVANALKRIAGTGKGADDPEFE